MRTSAFAVLLWLSSASAFLFGYLARVLIVDGPTRSLKRAVRLAAAVALLFYILAVVFARPANADDWTVADSKREAAFLVLDAADFGQTRYIASHPQQFEELNPILGRHPTVGKVNVYFAVATTAQIAIARALSEDNRSAFQWATILVEGAMFYNNHELSIGFDFF